MAPEEIQQHGDKIRVNGYTVLPQLIPPSLIEEMRRQFDRLLEEHRAANPQTACQFRPPGGQHSGNGPGAPARQPLHRDPPTQQPQRQQEHADQPARDEGANQLSGNIQAGMEQKGRRSGG